MNFYILHINVFLVLCLVGDIVKADECPEKLRLLCHEQKNCRQCMLAHSCCHWCYDQTTFSGTYRCDFSDSLSECGKNIEMNRESSVVVDLNLDFTVIKSAEDAPSAIQIKPQAFNIVLRKDTAVNLTFTYKAAKDYPLELYYLGDLSYSMRSHLETLKNLGDDLGKSLEKLTKHYKLAYGSFLDKPGMPFIWTNKEVYENPCRPDRAICEKTYLFKHTLNFTDNIDQFFEQVRNSKISANVDDLDGALEAIQQILVCDKQFGWSDYSRKIILLSTDSLLHTAGDGMLAGATEVNIQDLCLINSAGDHTDPLKYDYPSVGQIKRLLREHKANLIVAVTEDKIEQYKRMEKDILEQEAFVGVLQKDSRRNILELVKTGFYDFIRQVEFSANTEDAPELDIKFYGDCHGIGVFNETAGCQNVAEENPTHFKIELKLNEFTRKFSQQISIKEKNINEHIDLNIEYAGSRCECPNYRTTREILCVNGDIDCGICICDLGWTGSNCSQECKEESGACRKDDESYSCSARGDCSCGKCTCPEPYTGAFCEFECPVSNRGKVCSGRGTCWEGVCNCHKGFTKDDCSCEDSVDECRLALDSLLCNGKGECDCNQCHCAEGYTGKYCEVFKQKNLFCDKYEDYVKEYSSANSTGSFIVNGETVFVQEWEDEHPCASDRCTTIYYASQTERCLIDYCYQAGENNTVHLGTLNKKCVFTAQAKGIGLAISIFFAVLLGGLVAIAIKKCQIYQAEKAEFKKFSEANKSLHEMNPLYISPVSEYRNPMADN